MSPRYLGNYGDVSPGHRAAYTVRTDEGGVKLAVVKPKFWGQERPEGMDEDSEPWAVTVLPVYEDELAEDPERDPGGWAPWDFSDVGGVLERKGWDTDTLEDQPRAEQPQDYKDLRDPLLAEALLAYHGAHYLNAAEYERDTLAEALALASEKLGVDLAEHGVGVEA